MQLPFRQRPVGPTPQVGSSAPPRQGGTERSGALPCCVVLGLLRSVSGGVQRVYRERVLAGALFRWEV